MRNEDKGAEDYLRLKAEAEAIKKEVESNEKLKNLEVTTDMDNEMRRLIEVYERGKNEAPFGFRHKRMNKKIIVLSAVAVIMMLGVSMTSVSSRQLIKNLISGTGKENNMIQIDTDEEDKITSKVDDEDRAYEEIREVFGIEPVRIVYMPDSAEFSSGLIDKGLMVANTEYSYKDEIIYYQIFAEYDESSAGVVTEDQIIDEYDIELPDAEVIVKVYEGREEKKIVREAIFEYKDIYYILSGTIAKEEFDNIIKNLHFF